MVKFSISHEVVLQEKLDVVFKGLTSKENTSRVLELSGIVAWFQPGEVKERDGNQVFSYTFAERVPVLFGLTTTDVVLSVEQEVQQHEKRLIYRSSSHLVKVLKVRSFSEGPRGPQETRVVENLDITCPWLLKGTIQSAANAAHIRHMGNYHLLFSRSEATPQ